VGEAVRAYLRSHPQADGEARLETGLYDDRGQVD